MVVLSQDAVFYIPHAANEAVLRIKAAAKGAVARGVMLGARARVEMKFSNDCRPIAEWPQDLGEKQGVAAKLCPAKGSANSHLPSVPAGQEGCTRRRAPRGSTEVCEDDAAPRESVEVRRPDDRRASHRPVTKSEVISHVDGNVRSARRRAGARAAQHGR